MRAVSNRERRLIAALALSLFAAANLFGLRWLAAERSRVAADLGRLRIERIEAKNWLAQAELWKTRGAWLEQKQPKLSGTGSESGAFLEVLQQSARQQNITITQQSLVDPRDHDSHVITNATAAAAAPRELSVQLEVHGNLEAVIRWLASLQSPENFQAIVGLTLKSDAEPPKVVCTLTVTRWYAPQK